MLHEYEKKTVTRYSQPTRKARSACDLESTRPLFNRARTARSRLEIVVVSILQQLLRREDTLKMSWNPCLPHLEQRKSAAKKVRRRMVRQRVPWPEVQPGPLDSRKAQLEAIASDPTASADNREAAQHDRWLEFP